MNSSTRTIICAVVAMSAGGFSFAEFGSLSILSRAVLVGLIVAATMGLMLFVMPRPRKAT